MKTGLGMEIDAPILQTHQITGHFNVPYTNVEA